MTRKTHPRVMTLIHLIHLRTVIIDAEDAKKETPERGSDQTMRNFNGKIADDRI